jgi:hypothetical protein
LSDIIREYVELISQIPDNITMRDLGERDGILTLGLMDMMSNSDVSELDAEYVRDFLGFRSDYLLDCIASQQFIDGMSA